MADSGAHDARAVANHLLDRAEALGVRLPITSLLKIVYFAHGWFLATRGKPLIGQSFEAWQHGPVVRVVYDSFKEESGKPISGRAKKLDPIAGKFVVCIEYFSSDEQDFLDSMLRSYSKHHPYELSEMTHEAGSPWWQVWNAKEGKSNPGMRISDEIILQHFLRLSPADVYRDR